MCAQPAAACCIDGACSTLDSLACEAAGGLYQGSGSDCGSIVCELPPANDDCADSIEIFCGDTIVVDNTNATKEVDEDGFPVSCLFGGAGPVSGSVWYHIIGTGDSIQIDTCDSTGATDTVVAVYDAFDTQLQCYNFAEIACNDDSCGLLSRVCFDSEAGLLYHVLVGSFNAASRGEITINVTCPCPTGACCFYSDGSCLPLPESICAADGGSYQGDDTDCGAVSCDLPDECETAAPVACNGSATVPQILATQNATDPLFSCHASGVPTAGFNTVWFEFTATDTSALVSTCDSPSTTDTLLAIYDGTCGSLVEIACSEDAGCGPNGFLSEVCVEGLTIGNTYKVQVGAFAAANAGDTTLSVTCPCPPPPTVECPKGAAIEGECGVPTDTTNGGCNSSPVVYSDLLVCGGDVCGEMGVGGGFRDTDWYEVTVTEATIFTLEVEGAFNSVFGLIETNTPGGDPCTDGTGFINPFATAAAFTAGSVTTECLPPGTYYFFVSTTDTALACGAGYRASLSCAPCVEPEGACCAPDGSCTGPVTQSACILAGGSFQGDASDCGSVVCPISGCTDPQAIDCNTSVVFDQTAGVTTPGDPGYSCHFAGPGTQGTNSVWFEFTATDTSALLSTCLSPSSVDTLIAVYDGDCTTGLTEIACNDDAGCGASGFLSEVCADGLTIGNTYLVQVAAFSAADAGMTQLDLVCPCPPVCGVPEAGDCFVANGTPGCSDLECCELICAADPFCCDTAWDQLCADAALISCGGAEPPENDNCADRIEITDGTTEFTTVLATTDGTPDPLCDGFGTADIANDVWYNYTATCDGTLTVHTCGSTIDTRIAVYEGTDCPTGAAIACNDDHGGLGTEDGCGTLQSYLEVAVVCGQTYKIRVGLFPGAAAGPGVLTLSCDGTPCEATCQSDCVGSDFMPPGDGEIDGADLGVLLDNWGPCPGCCSDQVGSDFMPPGDDEVDGADLGVLLDNWGPCD